MVELQLPKLIAWVRFPSPAHFSKALIDWHSSEGRHHLPWQIKTSPYKVWVSEIMLQQTQVATVIDYYQRFIKEFSSIKLLSESDQNKVLSLWSGLGYYARARHLHQCAQILWRQNQGRFPRSVDKLCELPGIGRSTAGAILSLGMKIRAPILDGNVKRVLTRYHAIEGFTSQTMMLKQLWELSEMHTPQENFSIYNQAIMDLGATVCTRSKPHCERCPVQTGCEAYRLGRIQEFPQAIKSLKPKPQKIIRMLIIKKSPQALFFMTKRSSNGIWGGLWSFPECNLDQDIHAWCEQEFEGTILAKEDLSAFKHSFTHFDLTIHPVLITLKIEHDYKLMEPETQIWYNISLPLPGGVSAPVSKLLKMIRGKND